MPENYSQEEPITRRLHGILKDYPDGSQILREILQNSDDAKSTEQIFILDHNTYPSDSLYEPDSSNYKRINLKLDRYQGPALLAKNNTIFEERDFISLKNLSKSEKKDQVDKIGVMGLGFNSIYHITDSPSFISGDKYVIIDTHKWYFSEGGVRFNFVDEKLAEKYPDQLVPFRIPCDETCDNPFKKPFKGTIFRYPLRDSTESEISKRIYKSEEILNMFHNFYKKESINCLLFLNYIERIYFYELKKGATELELLYTIQLENADQIRQQRRLIAENIVPMMKLLKSKKLSSNNQLETSSYVALFSRQQKGVTKEINSWLILNYLDDLLETEAYHQKKFDTNISDLKLIPNVGLAIPLDNLNVAGRLFCFLPLPIEMPFPASVHGYFAVKTDRRSLWSPAEKEDLSTGGSADLHVEWNIYLFEKVLPKAWAKFLREIPFKVPKVRPNDAYEFWPIVKKDISGNVSRFCKDLLQNVIECLNVEDRVFRGPSSSNVIGTIPEVSEDLYNTLPFQESEFHWLSLHNGFFGDLGDEKFSKIIGKIGFPVVSDSDSYSIIKSLKNSRHKDILKFFSSSIIRTYLNLNCARWEDDTISRGEVLQLFEYILKDKMFDKLVGFKMIPLSDGTLGTLTQSSDSYVYIDLNNERDIFTNQLNKFIDKSIGLELYSLLHDGANSGWNLNIKILDEFAVADMIKFSLNFAANVNLEEIQILDNRAWICQLWKNILSRYSDLTIFEDIHLIPTSHSTLRKLKTPKKIFSKKLFNNSFISFKKLYTAFQKFGAVFIDDKFDDETIYEVNEISSYVINPRDIISVLSSFLYDPSYPKNLDYTLEIDEASELVNYLSFCLQNFSLSPKLIEIVKHLRIFTEIGHNSLIPLLPESKNWYLLPRGEEKSYGKIIYPRDKGGFMEINSYDMQYILENIIKIPRLGVKEYWRYFVIPYLELQSSEDRDIIIDKLFDRLYKFDRELIEVIGNLSFVPAGTIKMFRQQQTSCFVKLAKPTELFNPGATAVTQLFFEDERVFPIDRYGKHPLSSDKFFNHLQMFWIKTELTSNDIISRINIITMRMKTPKDHYLICIKALYLLKYIDDKWDQISHNNSNEFLEAILEKTWVPTIIFEKHRFSRLKDCCCEKFENLVCFVKPILKYDPKNRNFLSILGWNYKPGERTVLKQLEFCRDNVNKIPSEKLKSICNAIYKYMKVLYDDGKSFLLNPSFYYMKNELKNQSWILCEDKFRSAEEVFIDLFDDSLDQDSLIVGFPEKYYKFKNMFVSMGVRKWSRVGIEDLILIIKKVVEKDENRVLSINEIKNVIQILELITNRYDINPIRLDGLLIPSTKNLLISLQKIHFDDMGDNLGHEKKNQFLVAHPLVTVQVAKELQMQTLAEKICDVYDIGNFDWKSYEQDIFLTSRIKNIIKQENHSLYLLYDLVKEFLQIADDARATRFSVIVDQRQNNNYKKSLLSREMKNLQGPAIWIYCDAQFSNDDLQTLIELKKPCVKDETKVGKFGSGFNYAFHVTDLPSIVSGEYITFLDPQARFLPAKGYHSKRRSEIRINFIENLFKKNFPDQCHPYEAIECCDFTEEFKGTLFRFPLRKILYHISKTWEINQEMLFLRNIESCGFYEMSEQSCRLIWQTRINNIDNCRNFRQNVIDSIDDAQIYQLDIERINDTRKDSEVWAICTGGHDKIKPEYSELEEFSKKNRLKPRGGVACLLAKSDKKSLDNLKTESFPNPPELKGKIFSYLSLSMTSNLGAHLNGDFIMSENDFWNSYRHGEWNKYILFEVLADLHTKLLEYIMELVVRNMRGSSTFISHVTNVTNNIWPINIFADSMFKSYGLNVIRKLGDNNKKFFWTESNGGQLVSLQAARILEKEQTKIFDILIDLKIPIQVVKLDKVKMEHLNDIVKSKKSPNFPYTPISGKLLCKKLQSLRPYEPKKNVFLNDNTHDTLFQLLTFILQDKDSFEFLDGLPLVPLNDGSVGKFDEYNEGNVYYIGSQEQIELFPNVGPSKFVSIYLPNNLMKIFSSEEFSKITNIRKFDATTILDLLKYELPNENILSWNPNGECIPNNNWLESIWTNINKSEKKIELEKLSEFPLLPVIKPFNMLVKPDVKNPILYISKSENHYLLPVLVKLKVRFTNMIFCEDHLKNYILKYTCINIISSLEKVLLNTNTDIKQLFKDLTNSDYADFRRFIREELDTLIKHGKYQKNFYNTLVSLPIWPVHSSENIFVDAKSGILHSFGFSFFSFRNDTNFYNCELENVENMLSKLGATFMNEIEYIKYHILPDIKSSTPSQNYISFLSYILSLENPEIEECLKQNEVIPNKSLTKFVRADTLYDTNNSLFQIIFANTDKVLPSELQNRYFSRNFLYQDSNSCLSALERIGLKRQVNCDTYIECALEIVSQFEERRFPINAIEYRAKALVQYLYEHVNDLNFDNEQWNKIKEIKFIPSERNVQGQFYQKSRETLFESFGKLCSRKYKNICWTQCPIFDENVEPTIIFNECYPEIGKPSIENIIEHWFVIETMSKENKWNNNFKKELKNVINEIYKVMNDYSKNENIKMLIKSRINDPNKKIFLNGDDPFDEKNWVTGKDLIFGLKDDIGFRNIYKVKDCLKNYKDLLLLAGASEIESPLISLSNPIFNLKDKLLNSLLDKLIRQSDDKNYDVVFIIGEEKIGANRCVLSAVSTYFETMFSNCSNESTENKTEVLINDTKPNIFWVILRRLYGQPFEDAAKSVLRERDEFTTEQEYESYYLTFLIDVLKATDFYGVELKDEVEYLIINGEYINFANVCDILKWSRKFKVKGLEDYCKKYIKSNRQLVIDQLIEFHEDTSERSKMLDLLLAGNE
ncbi:hypothetical protein RclHR1_02760005 [Rhizophagus clarus]|uniref:BTB/POZ protein n=1 Tax=Rhizophagus clarus TaxID=94130 RepID=A0A2Z6R6G3_9GLOM|nr:hypothetical protein RclHR1_02760005 [Rhizophagus clarus]GES91902.1 BTB/POZ protein [Rhizophagus clarus]